MSQRHETARLRSQENLQKAREDALKKTKYDSAETRRQLQKIFSTRFGSTAYEWQLDVTEAILLGLDSVVIAGTGAGKTIPFMLPLLLREDKMILILSPLKVLQRDQVSNDKPIHSHY